MSQTGPAHAANSISRPHGTEEVEKSVALQFLKLPTYIPAYQAEFKEVSWKRNHLVLIITSFYCATSFVFFN